MQIYIGESELSHELPMSYALPCWTLCPATTPRLAATCHLCKAREVLEPRAAAAEPATAGRTCHGKRPTEKLFESLAEFTSKSTKPIVMKPWNPKHEKKLGLAVCWLLTFRTSEWFLLYNDFIDFLVAIFVVNQGHAIKVQCEHCINNPPFQWTPTEKSGTMLRHA